MPFLLTIYLLIPLLIIITIIPLNFKYKWYTKKDAKFDLREFKDYPSSIVVLGMLILIWPIILGAIIFQKIVSIIPSIVNKLVPDDSE
jgi:hypothetical protein